MNEQNKEIVILMFQFSIVVKGLERKLTEMGYMVQTFPEDPLGSISKYTGSASFCLFYLPGDIADDPAKKSVLLQVGDLLDERMKTLVLIGENRYHEELVTELSFFSNHPWLDRPVDMTQLEAVLVGADSRTGSGGKKHRLLIVDDDPSYAKMVREWLKEDYRADAVKSGMQAISFLTRLPENEHIDLILLDYEMPITDGPQVLQMLRQDPNTENIPVVFLTGIGTKEAVERVMSLKPAGYLLKTTTRADILTYLKKKVP